MWGYPPHETTKLKRDEKFAGLIWASKVYYSKGLEDVGDKQNGIKSSSKKEHEKDIIWLVIDHELEMIHGQ